MSSREVHVAPWASTRNGCASQSTMARSNVPPQVVDRRVPACGAAVPDTPTRWHRFVDDRDVGEPRRAGRRRGRLALRRLEAGRHASTSGPATPARRFTAPSTWVAISVAVNVPARVLNAGATPCFTRVNG